MIQQQADARVGRIPMIATSNYFALCNSKQRPRTSLELLESSTQSDSFETNTELASGLQLIDNLFTNVVDMEDKQLAVENYRGHLAGTFLKLLQFLTKYETSLRYSWADPSHDEPNCGRVSLHQAKILADSLAQVENLSSEDVTLVGKFE